MQCRRATITLGAPAPSPAHRFIRGQTTGRVNQATSRQPANHSMSTRHDHPGSAGALAGPSVHSWANHWAGQPSHLSPARPSCNGDAPRSPWERRRPRRPIDSYVGKPPGGSTKPTLANPPIIQYRRATITLGAPAPSPAHRFIHSPTTGRVNQATARRAANHSMSTRQISRHAPLRKTLPARAPALTGHPTPSGDMTHEPTPSFARRRPHPTRMPRSLIHDRHEPLLVEWHPLVVRLGRPLG